MSNVHLSDVESCWLDGFRAFHLDLDESANPYKNGIHAHYWREGWWEAFYNTGNLSEVYQQDAQDEVQDAQRLLAS